MLPSEEEGAARRRGPFHQAGSVHRGIVGFF